MTEDLIQSLGKTGIIAVVTLDSTEQALPLASALLAGGINAIELTLRTEAALPALELLCEQAPDLLIGAGTVLSTEQVRQVKEAGASFGVAPGFNPTVVKAARAENLPFAPGICTPSEIEAAYELGCTLLKFFPAEPSGGTNYLRSMTTPYAHLGLRFIPLGGLSSDNAETYLELPNVLALGGSWIAPLKDIQAGNWDAITARAQQARELIDNARK